MQGSLQQTDARHFCLTGNNSISVQIRSLIEQLDEDNTFAIAVQSKP
jgi:hypothetical protein